MIDTFVTKAANWDSPDKVKMTQKFVAELLLQVQPMSSWKAFEIGTGTGLVGLQIEHLVDELVLEDTSESMLAVLKQKLNVDSKVELMHGEVFDYKQQDLDFIFSCMAFHHINDIEKTLHHLASISKSGALIAIGDLVSEDGSFHRFEPIPHRGFDTVLLSEQFRKAGFDVKLVKIYHVLSRTAETVTTNFEQFILIAERL